MALFSWTKALYTGHGFMDDDHKLLVQRVNDVLQTLADRKSNTLVSAALGELLDFSRQHFAREEAQMLRIIYADAVAHKAQHAHLLQELQDLLAQLDSGQTIDAMGLYKFLARWVKDHIVEVDSKLAKALNALPPAP